MPLTPDAIPVRVNVLVVPDGLRLESGRKLARLSLSLTPNVDSHGNGPEVDLRRWPTEIIRVLSSLRVVVGQVPAQIPYAVGSVRRLPSPIRPSMGDAYCPEADREWTRL